MCFDFVTRMMALQDYSKILLNLSKVNSHNLFDFQPAKKLTIYEILEKVLKIDIISNNKYRELWHMYYGNQIVLDNDVLNWMGLRGKYREKRVHVYYMMHRHGLIKYKKVAYNRRVYYILSRYNYNMLLSLLHNAKATHIKHLLHVYSRILSIYREYTEIWKRQQQCCNKWFDTLDISNYLDYLDNVPLDDLQLLCSADESPSVDVD